MEQCADEAVSVLESRHREGAAISLTLEEAVGTGLLGDAGFMNNLI